VRNAGWPKGNLLPKHKKPPLLQAVAVGSTFKKLLSELIPITQSLIKLLYAGLNFTA
jgi:hypothetical protein